MAGRFLSAPFLVAMYIYGFLGTVEIVTGSTTHVIDECALTDRFLAQRPFTSQGPLTWRMRHFARTVSNGYVEAVANNDVSRRQDPADAF